MTDTLYERLAEALDRLPNGFPRTATGVEIAILRRIFSEEEAALASELTSAMEPLDEIAARLGLEVGETRKRLMRMLRRGLVWLSREGGVNRFRLAPFVVGIYEAQVEALDHELAHLVEHYMAEGGAAGIMGPEPALQRVLPARGAVKPEWVLPYDDVRAILLGARSFRLGDCICRLQQDHIGRQCDFPVRLCLSFSSAEPTPGPNSITQEEALAALDRAEELGLVHTVSNVQRGVGYVCNCCGCCCGILRGITSWGLEHAVARASYDALINAEACIGCGVCEERCQVGAIHVVDGVAVVDRNRCIGCGLCVTGCAQDAARLERKPEAETIAPPADFAAWERERLANRGLGQPHDG